MINLYLSDFILGIDSAKHSVSLDNVVPEFEKLFTKVLDIKKNYKALVGDIHLFENHSVCGYSLKDDIINKINDKNIKYYMLSILTKSQYLKDEQLGTITYNNINYSSNIISQCYQNKGILVCMVLNNQFVNRIECNDSYITLMHQENYEYIKKFILLDDTFYLSRIYLNMLDSGYNLYFHTSAYNTLCNDYESSSDTIDNVIRYILAGNLLEHYDDIHVKYERNGVGVIKENNPMIRIYFMRDNKNIYILEITNNHGKSNISNKLKSAEQRYKEEEYLKDIFDIDDNRYKRIK